MTQGDLSSGRRCSPGPDRLRVLRGHPEHRSGPGRSERGSSDGTRLGTGPTAASSPVTSPLPTAPYGAADLNPPGSAAPLPYPYAILAVTMCLLGLAMADQTWGLLAVLAGALAYRRGRRS